jgi:hypothetical protein
LFSCPIVNFNSVNKLPAVARAGHPPTKQVTKISEQAYKQIHRIYYFSICLHFNIELISPTRQMPNAFSFVVAQQQTTSVEILLWMTPSEAPKALQASECSELLDPTRANCWIFAQHEPSKFARILGSSETQQFYKCNSSNLFRQPGGSR